MALTTGSKAPDFTVKDQDGKDVKLNDFKGKKLVLYFYPKDMTSGCTAESCNLRDNYKMLLKQGFEVLGVARIFMPLQTAACRLPLCRLT